MCVCVRLSGAASPNSIYDTEKNMYYERRQPFV